MRQAKQPTDKQLEQGYEIVQQSSPTCQPRQNARLTGEIVGEDDPEEGYLGHDAD